MEDVQREKQKQLNEILITVAMKIHQIRIGDSEGDTTEEVNNNEDSTERKDLLIWNYPSSLDTALLFPNK